MTLTAQLAPLAAIWFRRLRFVLAVAVLWAGLHFLAGPLVTRGGLDRPLVLTAARGGPLGGLVVVALLWAGAALTMFVAGSHDPRQPLLTIGLALALWAVEGDQRGGTMDAWLILRHPVPGPPTGGPYWLLLPDYGWLLLGVAGAYFIGRRLTPGRNSPPPGQPPTRSEANRSAGANRRTGPVALVLTTAIAGIVALALTGPSVAYTFRGQVYFALLLGFLAAVFLVARMVGTPDRTWCCASPFLLGVIGLIVAGLAPALMLGSAYAQLDMKPAWALARPLPVEMIGVGLVGVLWLLGPRSTSSAAEG